MHAFQHLIAMYARLRCIDVTRYHYFVKLCLLLKNGETSAYLFGVTYKCIVHHLLYRGLLMVCPKPVHAIYRFLQPPASACYYTGGQLVERCSQPLCLSISVGGYHVHTCHHVRFILVGRRAEVSSVQVYCA